MTTDQAELPGEIEGFGFFVGCPKYAQMRSDGWIQIGPPFFLSLQRHRQYRKIDGHAAVFEAVESGARSRRRR